MVKEMSNRRINAKSVMLSNETHARLEKLGKKSETYEDVIKRLLDFYESKQDLM